MEKDAFNRHFIDQSKSRCKNLDHFLCNY